MRPPAKPWARATPSASRSSSTGQPSPLEIDKGRKESDLVKVSRVISRVKGDPFVLIAACSYIAILHASPKKRPKLKSPIVAAPPSAKKRLRIAGGRLLNVLVAVP